MPVVASHVTEPGWLLTDRVLKLSSGISAPTPVHVCYKVILSSSMSPLMA